MQRRKEASIQDVIDRIEKKVRNPDLANELVNKVKRYSISHNPADDLSSQEVRMIYGPDDCGDDFDLTNGKELDIGWTNHARYRSELRDVDPSAVNDEIREYAEKNLLRRFRQKINLIKNGIGKVVVDIDTTMNPERAGVITVIASNDWQKYLSYAPETVAGCQYYGLDIPVGVEPPAEGDAFELEGKPVVVQTVTSPEQMAAGKGGPVANFMRRDGIAYRVNCLPAGHEWLRPRVAGESKCREILPPEPFDFKQPAEPPVVFLAGSIDMGSAEDWQKEIVESLADVPCVALNPRRKDWDKTWKQEMENPKFREQVEWELKGLEQCSLIALCLTKDSKAPISLLELGIHASDGKMIVHCPKGYWRKGNVDIVCTKYGVPVLESFEDFKREVHRKMSEQKVKADSFPKAARVASDRVEKRIIAKEFIMSMHASEEMKAYEGQRLHEVFHSFGNFRHTAEREHPALFIQMGYHSPEEAWGDNPVILSTPRGWKKVSASEGRMASLSRHCAIYKAVNGKWYMDLAEREHGEEEDSTTYGPFDSSENAESYLENFSNPGSTWIDRNSNPVPTVSPNGRPVQKPQSHRGRGWYGSESRTAAVISKGSVCMVDMAGVAKIGGKFFMPNQMKILKDIVRQGGGKVIVEDVKTYGAKGDMKNVEVAFVTASDNPVSRMVGGVEVPTSILRVVGRSASRIVHLEPKDMHDAPAENCSECGKPTRYWMDEHIPLCPDCAKNDKQVPFRKILRDGRFRFNGVEWIKAHPGFGQRVDSIGEGRGEVVFKPDTLVTPIGRRYNASDDSDPMAAEKMSSLFLKLHSWATRKATSLSPGAPVATQILDGLNAVEKALKGKERLTGREAVEELAKAAKDHFTMAAPPFPELMRKYGQRVIRDLAGRYLDASEETHTFGSPLRNRRDYGQMASESIRVRMISDRIATEAKEFLGK
jgi:hypothetical protein